MADFCAAVELCVVEPGFFVELWLAEDVDFDDFVLPVFFVLLLLEDGVSEALV